MAKFFRILGQIFLQTGERIIERDGARFRFLALGRALLQIAAEARCLARRRTGETLRLKFFLLSVRCVEENVERSTFSKKVGVY
jgi:hypothetical protein